MFIEKEKIQLPEYAKLNDFEGSVLEYLRSSGLGEKINSFIIVKKAVGSDLERISSADDFPAVYKCNVRTIYKNRRYVKDGKYSKTTEEKIFEETSLHYSVSGKLNKKGDFICEKKLTDEQFYELLENNKEFNLAIYEKFIHPLPHFLAEFRRYQYKLYLSRYNEQMEELSEKIEEIKSELDNLEPENKEKYGMLKVQLCLLNNKQAELNEMYDMVFNENNMLSRTQNKTLRK